MSVTVWGPIADRDGITWWADDVAVARVDGRLIAERRHTFAALPSTDFDTVQPAHIDVDIGHSGTTVGEIVHLERDARALTAVAVLNLDADDLDAYGQCRWSTLTAHDRSTGSVELRSLALVKPDEAASVGLATLRWIPGDIRRGALHQVPIGKIPALLRRAVDTDRRRHYGDPLTIADQVRPETRTTAATPVAAAVRAGEITVNADRRSRTFTVTGLPAHGRRTPLTLMHGRHDPVGKQIDDDGVRTTFRLTASMAAPDALELVADGVYTTAAPMYNIGGGYRLVALAG